MSSEESTQVPCIAREYTGGVEKSGAACTLLQVVAYILLKDKDEQHLQNTWVKTKNVTISLCQIISFPINNMK